MSINVILGIIIFIFGSIIGSFLNVCIFRIPKEESIAFPPSHCGSCNHNLKPLDLIPILSWIFLRGKCRYCGEKVSIQYPIIEGITGLLFLNLYLNFGFTYKLIFYMLFTALFLVIAIIDLKSQDVYTSTIIFGVVVGVAYIIVTYFLGEDINILNVILGAIIPAGIIAIFSKFGAMGWGDVEIIFVAGLFLSLKYNLLNLFLSIVIGGIVACIFLALKKRKGKDTMAFGPYIALSSYIVLLYGDKILGWYLSFI